MNCSLQKNGDLLFQEIDFFLATMIVAPFQEKNFSPTDYFLKKLIKHAPLAAPDWKEYVAPELQKLFAACQDQVLIDLSGLLEKNSNTEFHTLIIPAAHRDAWLRLLSMMRLALSTQYDFQEEDFQKNELSSLTAPRDQALLQMEVFAVMLQCLIEAEEAARGDG